MATDDDRQSRLLDAALGLAAERGWHAVSLGDVARAADLSLGDLYREYSCKTAILSALIQRTDQAILAAPVDELAGEPARDRLFDILMRRFDALTPHKPALRAVLRDSPRDPLALLGLMPAILKSMAWMLEAAGLPAHGVRGGIHVNLLMAIHLATLRTWLADESADMAKTMAALDSRLRRAERLIGW
jgi:AcrR family transcriptional regulator